MPKIEVTRSAKSAAVKFTYDAELLARFKAAFPSAKWDARARTWTVGPIAMKNLNAFIATEESRTAVAAGTEAASFGTGTGTDVDAAQAILTAFIERAVAANIRPVQGWPSGGMLFVGTHEGGRAEVRHDANAGMLWLMFLDRPAADFNLPKAVGYRITCDVQTRADLMLIDTIIGRGAKAKKAPGKADVKAAYARWVLEDWTDSRSGDEDSLTIENGLAFFDKAAAAERGKADGLDTDEEIAAARAEFIVLAGKVVAAEAAGA